MIFTWFLSGGLLLCNLHSPPQTFRTCHSIVADDEVKKIKSNHFTSWSFYILYFYVFLFSFIPSFLQLFEWISWAIQPHQVPCWEKPHLQVPRAKRRASVEGERQLAKVGTPTNSKCFGLTTMYSRTPVAICFVSSWCCALNPCRICIFLQNLCNSVSPLNMWNVLRLTNMFPIWVHCWGKLWTLLCEITKSQRHPAIEIYLPPLRADFLW